jgi:hypothetical protein
MFSNFTLLPHRDLKHFHVVLSNYQKRNTPQPTFTRNKVHVQLLGRNKIQYFILIELALVEEGCDGLQLYKYITSYVLL